MGTSSSEETRDNGILDNYRATAKRREQIRLAQRAFHQRQKDSGQKMIYIPASRKMTREDKENYKLWLELGINPEGKEL
jgi:hypothetical protein